MKLRVGESTVCGKVEKACGEIWKALQPKYVKMPAIEEEWLAVRKDFEEIWIFLTVWTL